ncbi:MAG TPA: septum formation initiator family protein [Micromonosporaceae bacterium]|nr:septum formation initiator family protein [Micromonosporaceae bacterium]
MTERALPSGQGPARGRTRPATRRSTGPGPERRPPRRPGSWADGRRAGAVAPPSPRGGGVRRGAGPARQTFARFRRPRVTGRTAIVATLLVALVLAYAYPVRVYLAQQAEIAQLEADQAEQRQRIQDLAERLERWNDPEYVIAQARQRLQMVRQGELLYVVGAPPTPESGEPATEGGAWFEQVWSNLRAADDPAAP